jgi:restriction system protein
VVTELTIPQEYQLMWPTIIAMRKLGGSARNSEIEQKVIEIENYSNEVIAVMHTNMRQTKLQYRLAWARTRLKNLGALESRETTLWVLTEKGQKITQSTLLAEYKNFRTNEAVLRNKSREASDIASDDEDVVVVGEPWIDEMLDLMKSLRPSGFENLCKRILREHGFEDLQLTGGSNDKGIDGRGTWKMGLLSWDVIFQCKRYAEKVSSPDMQRFKGTMTGRNEKGLFITTGTFTKEAVNEAKRDGTRPIDLIDGEALCRLMKEKNLGLKIVIKEDIKVEKEFFDQFK